MSTSQTGAHRPARRWSLGSALIAVMAAALALGGILTTAVPAEAASRKVVIVVGPSHDMTAGNLQTARSIASKARSYGAQVVEIYTPNATWKRVKRLSEGAHLFVYLGHGNGWPSPYAPFQPYTKNGLGLNREAGDGHRNVKYWGEYYLKRGLHLAKGAVVLLMRTCYAAGNPEGIAPTNSPDTAKSRVDNFGAGFLRTGARVVIADIIGSADYNLYGLFGTNKTMRQIFWSSPHATRDYRRGLSPRRSPAWARGILDPYSPRYYYRSIIGALDYHASAWR